jgi:hypothetical protein
MIVVKYLSYSFIALFLVILPLKASFKFPEKPLLQAEEEDMTAHQRRLKIHHFLEEVTNRAAFQRKIQNPAYDPYEEQTKDNANRDWILLETKVTTHAINIIFKLEAKAPERTNQALENFAQVFHVRWWLQTTHFEPWLKTFIYTFENGKQHGYFHEATWVIKKDKTLPFALLKRDDYLPTSTAKRQGPRAQRMVWREALHSHLAEVAGLSEVIAPSAQVIPPVGEEIAACDNKKRIRGHLEKYILSLGSITPKIIAALDKEEETKRKTDLSTRFKVISNPLLNRFLLQTLRKKHGYESSQGLAYLPLTIFDAKKAFLLEDLKAECRQAFLKSLSHLEISLIFLDWYLMYQRDLSNSNCVLKVQNNERISLRVIDTEYCLTESKNMRPDEKEKNWTRPPFFLALPQTHQPLHPEAIKLVRKWQWGQFKGTLKLYGQDLPKEDRASLKKRFQRLKEIVKESTLFEKSIRDLYEYLGKLHPQQKWEFPEPWFEKKGN